MKSQQMKGLAMSDHKPHLKIVKPSTEAQKATDTTTDTIVVTPARVKSWKLPEFQREYKYNAKVQAVCEEIAKTLVIPGTITLGVMDGDLYRVDGQHRLEAFLLADIEEAFADVRYLHVTSEDDGGMAEMALEFARLNSSLVPMRPDDVLKALEKSNVHMQKIRRACPWIGYANIRRNPTAPILSMSAAVRCWFASAPEVPSAGGANAQKCIANLTDDEVRILLQFFDLAFRAWGKDSEHARLWSNLNLTICMWLFRRLVITPYSANTKKITSELFGKCLMSVGADEEYSNWLVGRQLSNRDRSPCYQRLKSAFAKRVEMEEGQKPRLPSPEWGGR